MAVTVTGRITQAQAVPLVSLAYALSQEQLNQGNGIIYTKLLASGATDGSGNFSLSLVPGIYQLAIITTNDVLRFQVTADSGSFLISDLLLN